MLANYLNQTCVIRRVTDTNVRGQPIYGDPLTVLCRLQKKYNLVQSGNDEFVPAEHICYLIDEISVGDTINGSIVHAVDSWVDLDGSIIGYKAVM